VTTLGLLFVGILLTIWFVGAVVFLNESDVPGTGPFERTLHATRPFGAILWPLVALATLFLPRESDE